MSVHAEIIAFLECDKRKLNIKYGVNRRQISFLEDSFLPQSGGFPEKSCIFAQYIARCVGRV